CSSDLHVPDGDIRGIVGAIKACGTLGPHGGGKHAPGHGKIRLANSNIARGSTGHCDAPKGIVFGQQKSAPQGAQSWKDRKSTRLNSSHVSISYAVFCLKKK